MKFIQNFLVKLIKPNTKIIHFTDVNNFSVIKNYIDESVVKFKSHNLTHEIHLRNPKIIELHNVVSLKPNVLEHKLKEVIFKFKLYISSVVSKENLPDKIADDFNVYLDGIDVDVYVKNNMFIIMYDTIFGMKSVIIKIKNHKKAFMKTDVKSLL